MVLIRDVCHQALITGHLTITAEEQLRQLLRTKYSAEDLHAFWLLQDATMSGRVQQESRLIAANRGAFNSSVNEHLNHDHLNHDHLNKEL